MVYCSTMLKDIFKSYINHKRIPRFSMYVIFTYIYHKNSPNVGKYAMHGSYGILIRYFKHKTHEVVPILSMYDIFARHIYHQNQPFMYIIHVGKYTLRPMGFVLSSRILRHLHNNSSLASAKRCMARASLLESPKSSKMAKASKNFAEFFSDDFF